MRIIDAILSSLDYEAIVRDIRQGAFQTAVLTRGCGLASTPHDPGPHHNRTPVREAGLLLDKEGKMTGFNLDYCKGCGICANICPAKKKAIKMITEGEAKK